MTNEEINHLWSVLDENAPVEVQTYAPELEALLVERELLVSACRHARTLACIAKDGYSEIYKTLSGALKETERPTKGVKYA